MRVYLVNNNYIDVKEDWISLISLGNTKELDGEEIKYIATIHITYDEIKYDIKLSTNQTSKAIIDSIILQDRIKNVHPDVHINLKWYLDKIKEINKNISCI